MELGTTAEATVNEYAENIRKNIHKAFNSDESAGTMEANLLIEQNKSIAMMAIARAIQGHTAAVIERQHAFAGLKEAQSQYAADLDDTREERARKSLDEFTRTTIDAAESGEVPERIARQATLYRDQHGFDD